MGSLYLYLLVKWLTGRRASDSNAVAWLSRTGRNVAKKHVSTARHRAHFTAERRPDGRATRRHQHQQQQQQHRQRWMRAPARRVHDDGRQSADLTAALDGTRRRSVAGGGGVCAATRLAEPGVTHRVAHRGGAPPPHCTHSKTSPPPRVIAFRVSRRRREMYVFIIYLFIITPDGSQTYTKQ